MLPHVLQAGFHDRPHRVQGVWSGDEETRRPGHVTELDQGLAQLVRIVRLLSVITGPHSLGRSFMRIVGDGAFGIADVLGGQQVGAEETRLDEVQLDAELLDLKREGRRSPSTANLLAL